MELSSPSLPFLCTGIAFCLLAAGSGKLSFILRNVKGLLLIPVYIVLSSIGWLLGVHSISVLFHHKKSKS